MLVEHHSPNWWSKH